MRAEAAAAGPPVALVRWPSAWQAIGLLLLAAVMACKVWLNLRINLNWDEFHYLSYIHDYQRGDAIPVLQTLHVQLFGWLTRLPLDEAGAVLVARFAMASGLLATVLLLWGLARHWVDGRFAWLAPLSYLLASPVFRHGNSFRPDSLLAPLLTGVAFLLGRQAPTTRALVVSGVLFGIAGAVSIKAILALPVVMGLLLFNDGSAGAATGLHGFVRRTALVGGAALLAFLGCTGLHALAIPLAHGSESGLVASAASKTLLEEGFFPAAKHLQASWIRDRLIWLLLGLGVAAALWRRQFPVAVLSLSLLPVVFYRNAFPYYYLVMLTPATVLVAYGVGEVGRWLGPGRGRWPQLAGGVFCGVLLLLFVAKFVTSIERLAGDRIAHQRAIVAAVHQVFPEPVPYLDHSGMIGSFPKANGFMSSWGVSSYAAAGVPFMPAALERRPPLLLVNWPVLDLESPMSHRLLPRDRQALEGYLRYWGPLSVAGAAAELDAAFPSATIVLPYPGIYRLAAPADVRVDGVRARDGELLDLPNARVELSLIATPGQGGKIGVTLWDARAQPPPASVPPAGLVYDSL